MNNYTYVHASYKYVYVESRKHTHTYIYNMYKHIISHMYIPMQRHTRTPSVVCYSQKRVHNLQAPKSKSYDVFGSLKNFSLGFPSRSRSTPGAYVVIVSWVLRMPTKEPAWDLYMHACIRIQVLEALALTVDQKVKHRRGRASHPFWRIHGSGTLSWSDWPPPGTVYQFQD